MESNNNRISEGNIHLVWSHCWSFLMQAKPQQRATVMDNGPSFLENDLLQYSRLYCLINSILCQQPHIAFTVKSSVYCLWCSRDLPHSLSGSSGWSGDIFTCNMYVWKQACLHCMYCNTSVLLSDLLYNYIKHYWYLPVTMRSFSEAAPEVKPDGSININKDERPRGCTRGEED